MSPHVFRERLRSAVQQTGKTWPELSARSGYSATYLQRLINGQRGNPTLDCVSALAETLNVKPAWLLGIDND
jgi:transcriptional regulator with XRE-family HTH domain